MLVLYVMLKQNNECCLVIQTVEGYSIPAGHQVCVCPTVNHRLKESWDEPETFRPDR